MTLSQLSPPARSSIDSVRTVPDGGNIRDKAVRDAVHLIQSCVGKMRAGGKDNLTQIWHDVMIGVVSLENAIEGSQLSASARLDAILWSSNGPTACLMPDEFQTRWRGEYEQFIHDPSFRENKLKQYRRNTAPAQTLNG
ncbi:hypothetical protein H1R20_g1170, partial [Candolleomyces eurysporus]